jgi:hypothetical protein
LSDNNCLQRIEIKKKSQLRPQHRTSGLKFCLWKITSIFYPIKISLFRHKASHMVLSIIFLEDRHKILLNLSIFYEYQQLFQHRICFSIQPLDYRDPRPRLACSFLLPLWCLQNLTQGCIPHFWVYFEWTEQKIVINPYKLIPN